MLGQSKRIASKTFFKSKYDQQNHHTDNLSDRDSAADLEPVSASIGSRTRMPKYCPAPSQGIKTQQNSIVVLKADIIKQQN